MPKEIHQPNSSTPAIERWRNSWLAKAGAVIGGLALAASVSESYASADRAAPSQHSTKQHRTKTWQAAPMQEVGVVDNSAWWSNNQARINSTVDLAHAMGYNAFKTLVPIVQDINQADLAKNMERTAFVAQATSRNDMAYYLNVVPQHIDGGMDGIPDNPDSIKRFVSQTISYMDAIVANSRDKTNLTVNLEIGNEVNYFYDQPQQTAINYLHLMQQLYPALRAEAQRLGVDLNVIGLELSSTHEPLVFLRSFADAQKAEGTVPSQSPMDMGAYHPYAEGQVGDRYAKKRLIPAYQAAIGQKPVIYTEYATGKSSDQERASAYLESMYIAACQGISVYFTFELFDDPPTKYSWKSAPYEYQDNYTWDPKPKPVIKDALTVAISKLLAGHVKCSAAAPSQKKP